MTYALFENVLNADQTQSYLFTDAYEEICIYEVNQVVAGLSRIEELSKAGYYLAGYIAYDACMGICQQLAHAAKPSSKDALLHFIAFKHYHNFSSNQLTEVLNQHGIKFNADAAHKPGIGFFAARETIGNYQRQFEQIIEHLKAGDSYQVNLTSRFDLELDCANNDSLGFYYHLTRAKPVEYAALLPFSSNEIISLSPELFFRKNAGQITVKPMKGTAPRGDDAFKDKQNYVWLLNDNKNKTENLIIVDLLRNDLSRFCETGTITAKNLFKIETFASVFQMVSEISGKVDAAVSLTSILNGLFPCGSITGAPKLRTMQIIDALEDSKRGIYCGAIGFILPNNDMCMSVAIRTLSRKVNASSYTIGAGGGITINSSVSDEWEEIKTKLKFITNLYQPAFSLIESLACVNGELVNLTQHLARLANSAQQFFFACDLVAINNQIVNYLQANYQQLQAGKKYKLRLELKFNNELLISHTAIPEVFTGYKVRLLATAIDSCHLLFKHKTTSARVSGLYTRLYQQYKPQSIDELIFINQDGIITESRYFNVIINYEGNLLTSPLAAGLLPGVYRHNLLADGTVSEQAITRQMLGAASAVYLCNDVRGMIKCDYLGEV